MLLLVAVIRSYRVLNVYSEFIDIEFAKPVVAAERKHRPGAGLQQRRVLSRRVMQRVSGRLRARMVRECGVGTAVGLGASLDVGGSPSCVAGSLWPTLSHVGGPQVGTRHGRGAML